MPEFLRPEAKALLHRWSEMAGAAAIGLVGLWVFRFGGWFFQGVGILLVLTGLAGAVIAWRRMVFRRVVEQPGIVEVDEGQIRFFGPQGGGFVALREVIELGLIQDLDGQSWWRLRESGGNMLAIPASASGAEALFDAFSALPGIDMGALTAALARAGTQPPVTLWRRDAVRRLPGPGQS
jgi:hypothetical protein